MVKFRVVLVGPEYQINLGLIARVMMNFGFRELYLVDPKCKIGFDAMKFSKKAFPILENAKVCSFDEAVKGCRFVVGTTSVLRRHRRTLRNPMTLKALKSRGKELGGEIALLFGREGIGLMEGEINRCDFLVTIPTHEDYKALSISHSVAVVLYELSSLHLRTIEKAGPEEKERLLWSFNTLVDRYSKRMRNPEKVKIAFKRIVGRSIVSDVEAKGIMGVLGRANAELKKR